MAFARTRGSIVHIYVRKPSTGRMTSKSTGLEDTPENQEKINEMIRQTEKQVEEMKMNKKSIGGGTSVEELLELHLASKAKNAQATRKNYSKVYSILSDNLDLSKQCVDEINLKKMTELVNSIYSNPKYSGTTQALYVRGIFNILDFANRNRFVDRVTLDDSLRPKRSKKKENPLPIEYVIKLVEYANEKGDEHVLAFILFMLHHGLRPNEIMNIRAMKIDFYQSAVTIYFSKTKQEYPIPIHPQCIEMLRYLIKIQKPGMPLFRIKLNSMLDIVKRYFKELGYQAEGFRPYNLRHTFVTVAKLASVRDDALAFSLGHSIGTIRSESYHIERLSDAAKELPKIHYPFPNFFELIGDLDTAWKIDKEFKVLKDKIFKDQYPDEWRKMQKRNTPSLKPLLKNLKLTEQLMKKGHLDKTYLKYLRGVVS